MANISNKDIATAIYEASHGKAGHDLSVYSKAVVEFLNKKRLISKSKDIVDTLEKIVNKEEGIVTVKVSSATKLATETKHNLAHELKHRYKARDIVWQEIVDENLLGGMRIEVNDEVIDLTLKNKVNLLKAHLTKSV
ncbi:MAG TPA: F0F1 ATP synthase subunit delta [Candidatus Paceibacterota bacterium]